FFVLVLSEIKELADRRLGLRVHLDQVEPLLLRDPARLFGGHHAQHAPVGADNADLRDADAMVDADLWPALLHARVEARSPHVHISCCCLLWSLTSVICEDAEGSPPRVAFPRMRAAGSPRAPLPAAIEPTGCGPSLLCRR